MLYLFMVLIFLGRVPGTPWVLLKYMIKWWIMILVTLNHPQSFQENNIKSRQGRVPGGVYDKKLSC